MGAFDNDRDFIELESLASLEACHRLASEAKPRPEKKPEMSLEGKAPSPARDSCQNAKRAEDVRGSTRTMTYHSLES